MISEKKLTVSDLEALSINDIEEILKNKTEERKAEAGKEAEEILNLITRLSGQLERFEIKYSGLYDLKLRKQFIGDSIKSLQGFLSYIHS